MIQGCNDSRKIFIVIENGDIQTLIRESTKITFICSGDIMKSNKTDGVVIEVVSHRLKRFIDSLMNKQAGFFIDYIEKQNLLELKKSTFKKTLYQKWNIENLLRLRD